MSGPSTVTAVSSSAPTRWERIGRFLGAVVALLLVLAAYLPWHPQTLVLRPLASWRIGLNEAFACGMRFGVDVVFTYGPWGFLCEACNQYHPATFAWMVLGRLFLASALFLALWRTSEAFIARGWVRLLWIGAFVLLVPDPFTYVLCLFLVLHCFLREEPRGTATLVMLVPAVSLISLGKFSSFILAGLVVFLISVDDVLRRRRFPRILSVYVLWLLFFWLLAGQSPFDIPSFLVNSFRIAAEYSEAMRLWGPKADILCYLGFAGALLVAVVWMCWRRAKWLGVLPAAAVAGALFLIFKAAFVRHDSHVRIAFAFAPAVVLTFLPALWRGLRARYWRAHLVVTVLLAAICMWQGVRSDGGTLHGFLYRRVSAILDGFVAGVQFSDRATRLRETYEAAKEEIIRQCPLPPVKGSVDCYPAAIDAVIAHGLPWNPRPVFHSYSAYSPPLAQMNAGHLRTAGRPDTVLFTLGTIDGRLPALDDGLSWPELLTRYDVCDVASGFLILERATTPRTYALIPVGERTLRMGEELVLPPLDDGGPLWARIELHPSLRYRLLNVLYKPPQMNILVTTEDGRQASYRLVPAMGRAGFLLSPLIDGVGAFAAFSTPRWRELLRDSEVTRIRIFPDPYDHPSYFGQTARVSLFRLDFPRQEAVASE